MAAGARVERSEFRSVDMTPTNPEVETMERIAREMVVELRDWARDYDAVAGETEPPGKLLREAADLLERLAAAAPSPSGLRPPAPGAEIPWPADFPEGGKPGRAVLFCRALSPAERAVIAGVGNDPDWAQVPDEILVEGDDRAYGCVILWGRHGRTWSANWGERAAINLLLQELGAARAEVAELRADSPSSPPDAPRRAQCDGSGRVESPNAQFTRGCNGHLDPPGCHACRPWTFCGGTGVRMKYPGRLTRVVMSAEWKLNEAQDRWERPCTGCVDCIGKENPGRAAREGGAL